MKMSEILRSLSDKLASIEQGQDQPQTNKSMGGTPVATLEPKLDDEPVMVPPLQAKLEILKKSEGIPSIYDQQGNNELVAIKKNAGLTAAQHEAGEDNDITG